MVVLENTAIALGAKRRVLSGAMIPGRPWTAYPWNPHGACDDLPGKIRSSIVAGVVLIPIAVCLALLNRPGVYLLENYMDFGFPVLLLLAGLWCARNAFRAQLRRKKYGTSFLYFRHFPFFLGETLECDWLMTKPLGKYDRIQIKLRCVEERWRTESVPEREKVTTQYQLYYDIITIEQGGEQVGCGKRLPITFRLPLAPLGTILTPVPDAQRHSADPWTPKEDHLTARYWELLIAAETPGLAYSAEFLLPVYERPAGVPS